MNIYHTRSIFKQIQKLSVYKFSFFNHSYFECLTPDPTSNAFSATLFKIQYSLLWIFKWNSVEATIGIHRRCACSGKCEMPGELRKPQQKPNGNGPRSKSWVNSPVRPPVTCTRNSIVLCDVCLFLDCGDINF